MARTLPILHRIMVGSAVDFALLALACSGNNGGVQPGPVDAKTGTGGAATAPKSDAELGGLTASGGIASTQPDSGGAPSRGGALATGGALSTSGATSTGAASSIGGVTSAGGAASAGGRQNTGGLTTKGSDGNGGSAASTGTSGTAIGGNSGIVGGDQGGTSTTGSTSTAEPSSGCGLANPPASSRYTINVLGTTREYITKIPDVYDASHPYRLIFGWHGAQYDANWVANGEAPLTGPYFGIESEAQGSAIFVAPQALSEGWSTQDLDFVDAIVTQFEAQSCIDRSRIFSVGFSMGAIMTITIGCSRSTVFRGIAPMSGSLPSSCPNGGHLAYWASHGTNDTTIPIAKGQAARDEFATRDHCTSQTVATDRSGCIAYQGCDQGYPVTWCTFTGVHEPAPFAGPAIWQFLSPL